MYSAYVSFLDLLLPHCCIVCGKFFTQLCEECHEYLDLCTNLETKLYYPHLPVQTVCRFNLISQHIIHRFKYSGYWSLATLVATLMYNHSNLPSVDYITWVPSHKNRVFERGFDHMQKVAKILSELTETPYVSLLTKTTDTEHQALQRQKAQRHQNAVCTFAYTHRQTVPSSSSLLLIDDVLTTGTTLEHCITILKDQGHTVYASVFCARI